MPAASSTTPPPPCGLPLGLLIPGEIPNHSFIRQAALAVLTSAPAANGSGTEPTGKPELISDMEEPKDASSSPKANGNRLANIKFRTEKNGIQTNIEALMPKLRHSYYYTKPTIQELAAKERAEPGYCGRVKDFVVGRHGVGSIRFLGQTDLRGVDLEAFIQIVQGRVAYCVNKPPAGHRFNGTAEMMLLARKFSYGELLCRDTQEGVNMNALLFRMQVERGGMEFVSYDPLTGECKWRTKYFSGFGLILFKGKRSLAQGITKLMTRIRTKLGLCTGGVGSGRPTNVLKRSSFGLQYHNL
ncbi:Peptidase S59, nucleoporin [Cynara cardunculus var. scolymus]|uniref:Peptidase S59, nucleoporin n=1 Tax=Cynara cardunculus var. scolymus TaxID=59895 RepID=A0A103XJK8_CYNCS|nr:Peptidase S59, nucleoporin [Cynara cardunculus var. scolymus]